MQKKSYNIMTAPPVDIVTPTQQQNHKNVSYFKNVRLTSSATVSFKVK